MDNAQEISPTKKWENTTADIRWALLPLLASIGGAWVFKTSSEPIFKPNLLTMLALILGGWVPLWISITHTNWAYPLDQWRHWSESDTLPPWPYLQVGTAGNVLHTRLSQARVWWKKVGRSSLTTPLHQTLLALLVSLLLGYIMGRTALLLTLLYFAGTQLAVLWSGGRPEAGTGWLALTQAGLPWLLGASLEQGIQTEAAVSSLLLIILVALYTLTSPLALTGPIIAAGYLIWQEHTITAGWLLLLSLPGFLKLGQHPSSVEYRTATLPWVLCMVGLIALVL